MGYVFRSKATGVRIGTVKRDRRDTPIHAMQLVSAQILIAGCVRRAAQVSGEVPHGTNIHALSLGDHFARLLVLVRLAFRVRLGGARIASLGDHVGCDLRNCQAGELPRPPLELFRARRPLRLIKLGEDSFLVVLGERIETRVCTVRVYLADF